MRRFSAACAAILVAGLASAPTLAQKAPSAAAPARMTLTVDSIMRGPDLVGWPPTGLRWSADSTQLYFEWRKPGEKEAATYVVGRDGGEPKRLTAAEAEDAPPAAGRWDKARQRLLASDDGDVVLYDGAARKRVRITRTTGSESNPRWART
jgi:hypothetical protein